MNKLFVLLFLLASMASFSIFRFAGKVMVLLKTLGNRFRDWGMPLNRIAFTLFFCSQSHILCARIFIFLYC